MRRGSTVICTSDLNREEYEADRRRLTYCTSEPTGKLDEDIRRDMSPACEPHCFEA